MARTLLLRLHQTVQGPPIHSGIIDTHTQRVDALGTFSPLRNDRMACTTGDRGRAVDSEPPPRDDLRNMDRGVTMFMKLERRPGCTRREAAQSWTNAQRRQHCRSHPEGGRVHDGCFGYICARCCKSRTTTHLKESPCRSARGSVPSRCGCYHRRLQHLPPPPSLPPPWRLASARFVAPGEQLLAPTATNHRTHTQIIRLHYLPVVRSGHPRIGASQPPLARTVSGGV
jgi:hypothetical protein